MMLNNEQDPDLRQDDDIMDMCSIKISLRKDP